MKKTRQQIVEAELRRLAEKNGGLLSPEKVVESARHKTSPLHHCFEWDDSAAAEAYRLWQARQLIRVVVQEIPGTKAKTEVFVSLSTDRGQGAGYRLVTTVLSHEQMRAQLLEDARAELAVFRRKYAQLQELAEVFAAVDRLAA